jgi:predicted Zn-dependent protease
MSAYENPQIPEGINVSPTHPLKDFALLLGGVSALIVVAVLALSFAAGYLVRFVPFEQERALASSIDADWLKQSHSADDKRREQYLQALGRQLAAAMDLPAEMQITVHYSSDDTVNAMATLGGNIVVFQGLIDTVDSENALAMVLAHEIAHVRHRHPIVAMGRGFTVMLALSALSGVGDGMIQQWVGSMGMLPMLAFSREQEEAADAARCKPCSASTATPTVLRPSSSAYRRNLPCRNRPRS